MSAYIQDLYFSLLKKEKMLNIFFNNRVICDVLQCAALKMTKDGVTSIVICFAAYASLCYLRPVCRHTTRTFAFGPVGSAFRSTSGKTE